MNNQAPGKSAPEGNQRDTSSDRSNAKRVALKNMALCAIWGILSCILWATGIVSEILHSDLFRRQSAASGIQLATIAIFGVFLAAVTGWAIIATLIGFVLATGKWPKMYDRFLPFRPAERLDQRKVRRAAVKDLWFCGAWAFAVYVLSTTSLPRTLGDLFYKTGSGGHWGVYGWLIGRFGPLLALLLFFGWVLALPFILVSLVTGSWFNFMTGKVPFSPEPRTAKTQIAAVAKTARIGTESGATPARVVARPNVAAVDKAILVSGEEDEALQQVRREEAKAALSEERAFHHLEKAMRLEVRYHFDEAIKIYRQVIDQFPETKAAHDAKISIEALLKKIGV